MSSMYNNSGELVFNQTTKSLWMYLEKDLASYVRGLNTYGLRNPAHFTQGDWEVIEFCRNKAPKAVWVGRQSSDKPRSKPKIITKADIPAKVTSVTSGGVTQTITDGTTIMREVFIPPQAVEIMYAIRNSQQRRGNALNKRTQAQAQLDNWNDPNFVNDWVENQKASLQNTIDTHEQQEASTVNAEVALTEQWNDLVEANGGPADAPVNTIVWLQPHFKTKAQPVPQ